MNSGRTPTPTLLARARRLVGVALAAVALVAAAVGCGGGSSGGGGAEKGGTLEFWTINLKEGYSPYITSSIKKYEHAHPGWKIKWIDIPDYEKTSSKLLAAISAGDTPDVVNVTPFILPKFASESALASIDEIAGNQTAAIKKQYVPGFWNAGVVNGKAYAIPYYGSASSTMYNKKIFHEAGLSQPPRTWDEVFRDSQIIHDKTGIAGFSQTLDDFDDAGNPSDILAGQAGVPLLTPDGKHAAFDKPAGVNMLAEYAKGVKEGWISHTSVNGTNMDSARELAQGKVAMVFLGPWILRWLKDNADASTFKQFAIAEHPKGPSGKVNAFLQNFAIPKASQHPKQALDFARYMSSTALQLAHQAPVLPPLVKQVHDPYMKSHPDTRVLVEQQPEFYWPLVPQVAELFDSLRQEFQAAMLGQKTASAALSSAASQWNQILAGS